MLKYNYFNFNDILTSHVTIILVGGCLFNFLILIKLRVLSTVIQNLNKLNFYSQKVEISNQEAYILNTSCHNSCCSGNSEF